MSDESSSEKFVQNGNGHNQSRQTISTEQQRGIRYLLNLWFGVRHKVTPTEYAMTGFGLMLLKYATEALVIRHYTGNFFSPLDYLNPVMSIREEILSTAPQWLYPVLVIWSLPFLWIAFSMSVRRAADAGLSPWTGMLIFIPLINLVFMLLLCITPGKKDSRWRVSPQKPSRSVHFQSVLLATGFSVVIALGMVFISIYLFDMYGASLFFAAPVVMGAVCGFLYNRPEPHSYPATLRVVLLAALCVSLSMLLFALEGIICLLMAAPIMLPLSFLGGIVGKAVADSTSSPHRQLVPVVLSLPLLAGIEAWHKPQTIYEVLTAVEIDAPPETVWANVIDFPELPDDEQWYFRMGIAAPKRARIDGTGVGATRYCIFTTGTFVEPITVWDESRKLAFDVTDQPAPMFELSPYRHLHPPHLDGTLQSKKGEFLLMPLEDGRTRLEGRTWYEFDMFPQSYWTLWSDYMIHRIHERVLEHIKKLSEAESQPSGD